MTKRVKGLVGAGIVALLIGAVALWLYSSLDSLIEKAIERYGSEITGVSVTVGSVNVSPTDGIGEVAGLRLGNPKGFATERALRMATIGIM
ncbi:MAG: hypothetical protein ACREUA_06675, partial [Burkholderiales bacterium]